MTRQNLIDDTDDIAEDDFLSSIGDDDFVFIVNKDGKLKAFLMPEESEDLQFSDSISEVFEFFKASISPRVLH